MYMCVFGGGGGVYVCTCLYVCVCVCGVFLGGRGGLCAGIAVQIQ